MEERLRRMLSAPGAHETLKNGKNKSFFLLLLKQNGCPTVSERKTQIIISNNIYSHFFLFRSVPLAIGLFARRQYKHDEHTNHTWKWDEWWTLFDIRLSADVVVVAVVVIVDSNEIVQLTLNMYLLSAGMSNGVIVRCRLPLQIAQKHLYIYPFLVQITIWMNWKCSFSPCVYTHSFLCFFNSIYVCWFFFSALPLWASQPRIHLHTHILPTVCVPAKSEREKESSCVQRSFVRLVFDNCETLKLH